MPNNICDTNLVEITHVSTRQPRRQRNLRCSNLFVNKQGVEQNVYFYSADLLPLCQRLVAASVGVRGADAIQNASVPGDAFWNTSSATNHFDTRYCQVRLALGNHVATRLWLRAILRA
ncbi:Hypothetical_protein [Hexamita inflata]|uniref:Hypothetical_protein n=1 Tax=Hexamita inflata TaxID=28002 RepID=A0AA86PAX0_9EUKA|nr:Hypothetical protein HINF_LOCUS23001 [Hexamita inflata]CAI9935358.1 Hypothetical protein HINF_LOCUS23003 [Hexamita inflata]CAI9935360.1 Hypothetical protein HINF_LOCUS23005 [Hexamita inflata]CAI9935362.1 Hypothetical protein HINF_LOCUS23007 [Hexamita inflata]CAI9935366.1 Hypothetical protein HINF_LOCUS23011 [Hexamita inflata]